MSPRRPSAVSVSMTASPRFLTPADVAEILATSVPQVMALIRDGELAYLRLGGRGQFRIEAVDVEDYIARQKQKARDEVERRRIDRAPKAPPHPGHDAVPEESEKTERR